MHHDFAHWRARPELESELLLRLASVCGVGEETIQVLEVVAGSVILRLTVPLVARSVIWRKDLDDLSLHIGHHVLEYSVPDSQDE